MNHICNASRYTDWRGEVGNSILLSSFTLSILLNVALIVLIIITRSATTVIVNYQIIQFLLGNVMVAVSQVYFSVVHLFYSISCEKIYISYFLHQVGFAITTSALMTITGAHLRMAINETCTIHVGRTVWIGMIFYLHLLLIPVIYCSKLNILRRRNKVHSVIGIAPAYAFNNTVLVSPRFSTTHTLWIMLGTLVRCGWFQNAYLLNNKINSLKWRLKTFFRRPQAQKMKNGCKNLHNLV